jgi:hypothetical protein
MSTISFRGSDGLIWHLPQENVSKRGRAWILFSTWAPFDQLLPGLQVSTRIVTAAAQHQHGERFTA